MHLSTVHTRVKLLEADADLARDLDDPRREAATRRLEVPVVALKRGAWAPPPSGVDGGREPFGLLVLEGLMVREATVGEHPCAELVGPGDLIRLGVSHDTDELLDRSVDWTVLTPTQVAVLAPELVIAAAPWPEVLTSLIDRAARRADRLIVLQAITHLTRVDDRLLALLWYLAERWGRVVPGGIVLTLRLPHRTLAGMVGARRPSVTTALGQLMARGAVERRADGAWVLRGGPPERRDNGAALAAANGAEPNPFASAGHP